MLQFKNAPGSHAACFLILHELTAVLPVPFVYHFFKWTDLRVPMTEDLLQSANTQIRRLSSRFNIHWDVKDDDLFLQHLVMTYAVMKMAMPLRLAASAALTPWFHRRCWVPVQRLFVHQRKQ